MSEEIDDITIRLRKAEAYLFDRYDIDGEINMTIKEAADEIERLREGLRRVIRYVPTPPKG